MPEVRRANLPRALFRHLLDRIQDRSIPADQLGLLAAWLDTNPIVPTGRWYRRFPSMTICREGEMVKTFLLPHMIPAGTEVK